MRQLEHEKMSLMYIRNNSGPNIEPWGTPHLIGSSGDSRNEFGHIESDKGDSYASS